MQAYLYGVRRGNMADQNGGQVKGFSCFIGYPADGVDGDEVSKVFVSDSMVQKCACSPAVRSLVNVDFTPKGQLSGISTVKEKLSNVYNLPCW